MSILAFVTAVAAMLCFSLAMARHHRDLFGRSPSRHRQWLFRLLGVLGTALCLLPNLRDGGSEISVVTALGQLMAAGILVGLLLARVSAAGSRHSRG